MSNNNCIGPTNIIPNNNQVVLLDNNKSITVIDNNCCTNVDVTQPITSVVQVLTGPIGPQGSSGSIGPSGSQGPTGPSGSSAPFTYIGNNIWNTTSSIQVTGSFIISGSNTFKNIGPAQFTGSTDITGSLSINGVDYGFTSASFNTRILNNSSSISSLSGSFLNFSSSYNTGSFTGSFTGSLYGTSSYALQALSSSFALTASYALNSGTVIDTGSFVTTSSFNNFTASYNTGSFTGSFYGSIIGTASYTTQALSSSYAESSSYALTASYLNTLNQDVTVNGNVNINGTASIAYLNVTYESASVIYSSGSNQFGDATNDTQTLIGTVKISGSLQLTGSANLPSITGSLFGTASYADQALTASYASTYAPVFPFTGSAIISGSLEVTGSVLSTVGYGVGATPTSTRPFNASATVAGEYSYFITNLSTGVSAQAAIRLGNNSQEAIIGLAGTGATVGNGLYARALNFRNSDIGGYSFLSLGNPTSGAWTGFRYIANSPTNQTASTPIVGINWNLGTRQWATGNITTQKEFELTTPTYSFVGASTITSSYTMFVEAATAGTNATITNNFALGTTGRVQIKGSSSDLIDLGTNDGGFYNIKLGYNGVIGSTTGPTQLGNLGGNALGYYLPSKADGSSVLANTWATGKITYQAYQHNFTFQSSANQSAEYSRLLITGGQVNFTSSISTQRFAYLTSPTIVFNTSNTVTSSYGLYVEAATAGTNATITNNYAAGFLGGVSTILSGTDKFRIGTVGAEYFRVDAADGKTQGYGGGGITYPVFTCNSMTTYGMSFAFSGYRIGIVANNVMVAGFNNSEVIFSPAATTTGASTTFTYTAPSNTNQTATTNIPNFRITGNNKQWATGNITNQYWNYLTANTASFVGASTMTNSYGLFVEAATAGTNATITNNYAAGFNGRIVITESTTNVKIGNVDGVGAGLWFQQSSPSGINYGIYGDSNVTQLNAATNITFRIGTDNKVQIDAFGLTLKNGYDIITGTTTGTKLGTATTQKLSFWNATPVTQSVSSTAIDTLIDRIGLRASGGSANFDTPITASIISGSSITGSLFGTASYATQALTASYASTYAPVFPFTGSAIITGSLIVTGSITATGAVTSSTMLISGSGVSRLTIVGSGSSQPIFTVQGSQGELFSVTDSLSGSLFSVNDISGLPIVEVFSDNTTLMGSYLNPMLITTIKVTQTNSGSFVVYSLPTSSYDTAFYEYSTKSGSNGRAGTIMAIQSGSSVNYTEVVTTDFGSTSAITFSVTVSGSNIILSGSSTTGSWTTKCIIRGL